MRTPAVTVPISMIINTHHVNSIVAWMGFSSNPLQEGINVVVQFSPMFRRFYFQKVLCSECPMFRRFYVQKVLYSEGSMFRRFYVQKYLFRSSYV